MNTNCHVGWTTRKSFYCRAGYQPWRRYAMFSRSAHPDIGRYFAGASDEVVQILKDIAREDALPSDAVGVAMRMGSTVARLNEIDPYYTFDFTIAEDRTVVSCRPRYPDALRDRPISFSAQLKLDDATSPGLRAAIDDFMLYGSPVQIPAENIGGLSIDMPGELGSQFAGGGMALDGKIAAADAVEAKYLVLRVPPVPPVRHVLTMDIPRRSKGPVGGFRLKAEDRAGLLTLDLQRASELPVQRSGAAQGRGPGPSSVHCPGGRGADGNSDARRSDPRAGLWSLQPLELA